MKTRILEVNKDVLLLESSPFRKAGGGQPCDFGTLINDEFEAVVCDVLDDGVKIKVMKGSPEANMEITAEVDMNRRNTLTRMHTGEHIFFKSLEKEYPTLKLSKINLDEKESLLVVYGELDWDVVLRAEKMANSIIRDGLDVVEHMAKKEDVQEKFPSLRIKLDRIKSDEIRVIEVKSFDFSACAGTHCKNTSEVGSFLVTKLNSSGPDKFEIKFKVDVIDDLYKMADVARKVSSIFNVEMDKVENTLTNLKDNFEKYKKMAREVKAEPKTEEVNGVNFLYNEVELEPKALMKQIPEMVKEKTVVCFVNKTEKNIQVMVAVSDDLNLNSGEIIKKLGEKFNGKGGGKKNFAQGAIETDKIDDVFSFVKELI